MYLLVKSHLNIYMENKITDNLFLDACSTTPPLESVINEISKVQRSCWANSSSIHSHGILAANILEKSRISIANKLVLDTNQILFTNGATHSIQIAFEEFLRLSTQGRFLVSSVEHPAVLEVCNIFTKSDLKLTQIPVDKFGLIELDIIDKLLQPPTIFASIIWGQSEIGSIQPIKFISELCSKRNIKLHIDATQIFSQGILELDKLYFDFISLSAHKFRGPKGVGILIANKKYVNQNLPKENLFNKIYYKSGTTPVALVSGMAIAFDKLSCLIKFKEKELLFPPTKVSALTETIKSQLFDIPGIELIGHPKCRLPHHISILLKDRNCNPIPAREFVRHLSREGISISTGTACGFSNTSESYVLEAIGIEKRYRNSCVRISIGEWIFPEDIDIIVSRFKKTFSYFYNL